MNSLKQEERGIMYLIKEARLMKINNSLEERLKLLKFDAMTVKLAEESRKLEKELGYE
ncbi:MAG: hypothetical protein ACFFD4_08245 [Candidatus Odinarchaeota archaeon]